MKKEAIDKERLIGFWVEGSDDDFETMIARIYQGMD